MYFAVMYSASSIQTHQARTHPSFSLLKPVIAGSLTHKLMSIKHHAVMTSTPPLILLLLLLPFSYQLRSNLQITLWDCCCKAISFGVFRVELEPFLELFDLGPVLHELLFESIPSRIHLGSRFPDLRPPAPKVVPARSFMSVSLSRGELLGLVHCSSP